MITRKNDAFDAQIVNMRLTKIFIAIFAPDEKLASSATLATLQVYIIFPSEVHIEQSLLFLGN